MLAHTYSSADEPIEPKNNFFRQNFYFIVIIKTFLLNILDAEILFNIVFISSCI